MIKLDNDLLQELGLAAMPPEEKSAFLKHMYETLEMRVGTRLAEKMTDQQMAEFEQFINANDEQGAFQWLETNFPNYKEVVAEEFDKLKAEIKAVAPDILAASQAQALQRANGGAYAQSQQQQPPLPTQQPSQQPSATDPTTMQPPQSPPYDNQSHGAAA